MYPDEKVVRDGKLFLKIKFAFVAILFAMFLAPHMFPEPMRMLAPVLSVFDGILVLFSVYLYAKLKNINKNLSYWVLLCGVLPSLLYVLVDSTSLIILLALLGALFGQKPF
jgi:hypothetical protein